MAYDIYFNDELVDTEMSFMDAMMYIQGHDLFVIDEKEYIMYEEEDTDDNTVKIYCEEL